MKKVLRASALAATASILVFAAAAFGPAARSGITNHAGIVVQHSDGSTKTRCVGFDTAEISGFRLLRKSGFKFEKASFDFGKQVCWLGGEGCRTNKPSRCSDCAPRDGEFDGRFWSYYVQEPGDTGPQFSNVGASDRVVRNGSLDYWFFDDGSHLPQTHTFSEVCAG